MNRLYVCLNYDLVFGKCGVGWQGPEDEEVCPEEQEEIFLARCGEHYPFAIWEKVFENVNLKDRIQTGDLALVMIQDEVTWENRFPLDLFPLPFLDCEGDEETRQLVDLMKDEFYEVLRREQEAFWEAVGDEFH